MQINQAHFSVGHKVRQTIEDLGGAMPEDLPTLEKSIQRNRSGGICGKSSLEPPNMPDMGCLFSREMCLLHHFVI